MSNRYSDKRVRIDPNRPEAVGVCDRSGFVYMRKDLVKQMEWVGDSLVWTGLYVGPDQLDTPNEQLRTSHFPVNPRPVMDARTTNPTQVTWGTTTTTWGNSVTPWGQMSETIDGPIAPSPSEIVDSLRKFSWGQ